MKISFKYWMFYVGVSIALCGPAQAGSGDPSLASLRATHSGAGVTENITCFPSGFLFVEFVSGGFVFFASETSDPCGAGGGGASGAGIGQDHQNAVVRSAVDRFLDGFDNGPLINAIFDLGAKQPPSGTRSSGNGPLVDAVLGSGSSGPADDGFTVALDDEVTIPENILPRDPSLGVGHAEGLVLEFEGEASPPAEGGPPIGANAAGRGNDSGDEGYIEQEEKDEEGDELNDDELKELRLRLEVALEELSILRRQSEYLALEDLEQRERIFLAIFKRAGLGDRESDVFLRQPDSTTPALLKIALNNMELGAEYQGYLESSIEAYAGLTKEIGRQKDVMADNRRIENRLTQAAHPRNSASASALRAAIFSAKEEIRHLEQENAQKRDELDSVEDRMKSGPLHWFEKPANPFGNPGDFFGQLKDLYEVLNQPIRLASASEEDAWLIVAELMQNDTVSTDLEETGFHESLRLLRQRIEQRLARADLAEEERDSLRVFQLAVREYRPDTGAGNPGVSMPSGSVFDGARPSDGSAGVNLLENVEFFVVTSGGVYRDEEGTRDLSGDHWSVGAGARFLVGDKTGMGLSATVTRGHTGGRSVGAAGTDTKSLALSAQIAHQLDSAWVVDSGIGLQFTDYDHRQGAVSGSNDGLTLLVDLGLSARLLSTDAIQINGRLGHKFARTSVTSYTASDGSATPDNDFNSGEMTLGFSGGVTETWGTFTMSADAQYDTIRRGAGLNRFAVALGSGVSVPIDDTFALSAGVSTLVGRSDYRSLNGSLRLGAHF